MVRGGIVAGFRGQGIIRSGRVHDPVWTMQHLGNHGPPPTKLVALIFHRGYQINSSETPSVRDLQHDPHALHLLLLPRVQSTIELYERDDIICRLFCQAYKHFYSIAGIGTIRLILLTRLFTFPSC